MQKKRLFILLSILVVTVTSCSNQKNDKKEKATDSPKKEIVYYSGKLSDEEKESTHLSLDLAENIVVDADITSYSKYKDGMDSYFIENLKQDRKTSISSYRKNPDIFGTPLKQFIKELAEVGQCSLSNGRTDTLYDKEKKLIFGNTDFQDSDQNVRRLIFTQNLYGAKKFSGIDDLALSSVISNLKNIDQIMYGTTQLGENMMTVFPDYDMSDLSFCDKEEVGEKLKDFVSKMLKMEVADQYDCVPVTKDSYRRLINRFYEDESTAVKPFEEDYYFYRFFPAINGLRWRQFAYGQTITVGNEPVADDVIRQSESWNTQTKELIGVTLQSMDEKTQRFVYGENGIQEMTLSHMIETTDVYKKQQSICPIDVVLTKIQEELTKGITLPSTIYNIELCYSSSFSDAADGEIRNITKPCWIVQFWKQAWDGKRCAELCIDGVTGEVIGEEIELG